MTELDWKNRADSYKELCEKLNASNKAMKKLLLEIHDSSDSVSMKVKIMETLK